MTTSASTGASSASCLPRFAPHLVQAAAAHDRVGPGEVDVLEHAQRAGAIVGAAEAGAALVDHDHLARLELALGAGADEVEGTRLGREHPGVVEAADDQRADPVGVAEAGQAALAHDDGGERALDPAHRVGDRLAQVARFVLGDQRGHHLGVGRRAHRHPARAQLLAQGGGVREVAVVPERDRCGRRRGARPAGRSATRSSRWSSSGRARWRCGPRGRRACPRRRPG